MLASPRHAEAAVDLAHLSGLQPAGVPCEIVSTRRPTHMTDAEELAEFSATHGLFVVSITQLVTYRRSVERERITPRLPHLTHT